MSMTGDVPGRDEVAAYLSDRVPESRASELDDWADVLTGLPLRYIDPVVQIAVSSGNHVAMALAMAARYSQDQAFVDAASAQLSRVDGQLQQDSGPEVPPAVERLVRRRDKLAARLASADDATGARLQRQLDELSLAIGREMGRHDAQAVAAARAARQGNRAMRRRGGRS